MNYEIDFIGVPDAGSADAICFRWQRKDGSIGIGVYDGGTQKYAEALCELLDTYYFTDVSKKVVDFVVCSHSDQDHCAGLKLVLEKFTVKKLYLNIPWLYTKELIKYKQYSQTTEDSVTKKLKNIYPYVFELEKLAKEKEISIESCFTGRIIEENFYVFSPTKTDYITNIIDSDKNNLLSISESKNFSLPQQDALTEDWNTEQLPDYSETSAENESSIILLGCMKDKDFLLTGDAGIKGLSSALQYSVKCKYPLRKHIFLYQLPHHGGGKNISPKILDDLVGFQQPENTYINKIGIASAGIKGHHPYKIALNAFTRRGVSVYVTKGKNINYSNGFPDREGYSSMKKENIYKTVEKWSNNK